MALQSNAAGSAAWGVADHLGGEREDRRETTAARTALVSDASVPRLKSVGKV
jgi:hypothetical protein